LTLVARFDGNFGVRFQSSTNKSICFSNSVSQSVQVTTTNQPNPTQSKMSSSSTMFVPATVGGAIAAPNTSAGKHKAASGGGAAPSKKQLVAAAPAPAPAVAAPAGDSVKAPKKKVNKIEQAAAAAAAAASAVSATPAAAAATSGSGSTNAPAKKQKLASGSTSTSNAPAAPAAPSDSAAAAPRRRTKKSTEGVVQPKLVLEQQIRALSKHPKIKRANSSWACFLVERSKQLSGSSTNQVGAATKIIGKEWAALTDAQKKPYELMAAKDAERYKAEFNNMTAEQKLRFELSRKLRKRNNRSIKQWSTENGAPVHPPSSYLAFSNKVKADVKARYPNIAISERNKVIANMWNTMPAAEKTKFVNEHSKLSNAYKLAKAKWDVSHPKPSKSELKASALAAAKSIADAKTATLAAAEAAKKQKSEAAAVEKAVKLAAKQAEKLAAKQTAAPTTTTTTTPTAASAAAPKTSDSAPAAGKKSSSKKSSTPAAAAPVVASTHAAPAATTSGGEGGKKKSKKTADVAAAPVLQK
jgi:hypothetical protein